MVSTLRTNSASGLTIPWAEHITRSGVTRDAAFSYEGGNQATMTIRVNWDDTVAALHEILGGARLNRTTGQLDRTLPMRHPEFFWLYASRVTSVHPLQWDSKVRLPYGTCSAYQYSIITIVFTQPRWVMLEDARIDALYGSPRKEYRRFVERRPEPAGEFITRDRGSFQWIEGGGATGPQIGTDFPAPLGQHLPKALEVLVWKRVPQVGLFSNNGLGDPTNIFAAIGKINDDEFMGWPAGTLLLQTPRLIPLEVPIFPSAIGANENLGQPAIFYDVELPMLRFDPTPGGATRGHNLAPHTDGKWYKVADRKTGLRGIFEEVDFETIFQMVD